MVESIATLRESEKLRDEKVGKMGAMEQVTTEGDEADTNSKKGEAILSNTMRRATSVDDLFAPMWHLNVQSSGTGIPTSHQGATSVAASSSGRVPVPAPHPPAHHASRIAEGGASSSVLHAGRKGGAATRPLSSSPPNNSSTGNIANVTGTQRLVADCKVQRFPKKEEEGLKRPGTDRPLEASSSSQSSQSSEPDAGDVKPSLIVPEPGHHHHFTAKLERHSTGKEKASSSEFPDPRPPSNSTSDDDHHAGVDERKQKRMLSNRESARRSRLRKQQHLDELRAQVAHLKTENGQMLTKLSMATQRYECLSTENYTLRGKAMYLTSHLQQLNQTAVQLHPGGLRGLDLQSAYLDPSLFGATPSTHHHSPFSMVQEGPSSHHPSYSMVHAGPSTHRSPYSMVPERPSTHQSSYSVVPERPSSHYSTYPVIPERLQ